MKRLVILIGAACAALSFASHAQKLTTRADSLAYYLGRSEGARMALEQDELPADADNKMDRKAFIQGVEKALEVASAKTPGYAEGYSMAMQYIDRFNQMQSDSVAVNRTLFFKEFKEQFLSKNIDKTAHEADRTKARDILQAIQMRLQQERLDRTEKEYIANMAAGAAFIDSVVAADPSVVRLPDGLVYKVLSLGSGPKPLEGQEVGVIYTGRFTDGAEFDSSKGRPVNFNVDRVIPGFSEGLRQLPEGSKAILYIPGDLAYGRQAPPQIGPGRTLIFDVQLVKIINKE